jgi:adenine-specific DNA-methyltransferase
MNNNKSMKKYQALIYNNFNKYNKAPPFRLIGSKYNNLENIQFVINKENITGNTFFDAFSGSASVGAFFKKDYNIISNDILYFSYVLQRGLITLNYTPSFSNIKIGFNKNNNIITVLDYLNHLSITKGFIYKHYTPASLIYDGVERKYFSKYNGGKIDAVRNKIEEWFNDSQINENEYFYLLTSLLYAVQKVANISGTYGAYNKFWDTRSKKNIILKPVPIINSNNHHIAYNSNIFNIIDKIITDIAYFDPPYNSRQYISNYHLLETIAKNDNPIIKGKTGIRVYSNKEKSSFCSVISARKSLKNLLDFVNAKTVLISYSSDGILKKDEIIDIIKSSKFKFVSVYDFAYRKFKSNQKNANGILFEYIFVGVIR